MVDNDGLRYVSKIRRQTGERRNDRVNDTYYKGGISIKSMSDR